jgi:stress-induced-phosphoprotein 1
MADHTAATPAKNRGNGFYKRKQYNEALKAYSEGVDIDPTWHVLYSNRSQTYYQMKKYVEAHADASKAIQVNPDFAKGYHRAANALVKLNRYTDALAVLESAYKRSLRANKDLEALDDAIRPKAEAQRKAEVKKMPILVQLKEKGNNLFKTGNYDEALQVYGKIVKGCKLPGDLKLLISAHCNRALCYQQQSAFSLVIEECNKALDLDQYNPKALMRRSSAFEGMEKYRLALEDVRKVLLRHPKMAVANKAQHRLSNAVRALKAAKKNMR